MMQTHEQLRGVALRLLALPHLQDGEALLFDAVGLEVLERYFVEDVLEWDEPAYARLSPYKHGAVLGFRWDVLHAYDLKEIWWGFGCPVVRRDVEAVVVGIGHEVLEETVQRTTEAVSR